MMQTSLQLHAAHDTFVCVREKSSKKKTYDDAPPDSTRYSVPAWASRLGPLAIEEKALTYLRFAVNQG